MIQYEFGVGRNPLASIAWDMYLHKDLNSVSVGWRTIQYKEDEDDKGKKFLRVTRARLLETSGVTVPMDPGALAERLVDYSLVDPTLSVAVRKFVEIEEMLTRPGWDDTDPKNSDKGQIRYRVRDISLFDPKSLVTLSLDVKGKKDVQILRGNYKGGKDDGKKHAQSIGFNKKDGWTKDGAKSWWADHKESLAKGLKVGDARWEIEGFSEFLEVPEEENPHLPEGYAERLEDTERVGKVISAKNLELVNAAISACRRTIEALQGLKSAAQKGEDGGGVEIEATNGESRADIEDEPDELERKWSELVTELEQVGE
jgi:hypothetical protein